jgi:hypothetical protein
MSKFITQGGECWLCHDKVATLYAGAPGIEDTFDEVCLTCSVERIFDYDGRDISEVGKMTAAQMRKVAADGGVVRV